MTYKENTPTYNVNRKITNFGDFCKTCERPKLKKISRQTKPNSAEQQQYIGNFSQKYNPVTRKIDYMSPEEVEDRIKSIEGVEESKINESKFVNFFNWLSELKEEIKNDSNHDKYKLVHKIWKKAKEMSS